MIQCDGSTGVSGITAPEPGFTAAQQRLTVGTRQTPEQVRWSRAWYFGGRPRRRTDGGRSAGDPGPVVPG